MVERRHPGPGDRAGLTGFLQSVGVPNEDIDSLFEAIESDGKPESGLGPATSSWIGRLLSRSTDLGIGAADAVIADAIVHYLGIA